MPAEPGLLFYLSGDHGLNADYAAGGNPVPNYVHDVKILPGGASGSYIQCGNNQLLSYWAPGNIYAQRGTLSFYWRSRDPVDETAFPIFRVGYADHSSWDQVWLRIDYNGHGFDAFVTDVNLGRTRVSYDMPNFPKPDQWALLTLTWDETTGIRFYVDGKMVAEKAATGMFDAALDQFGPHSRIIGPTGVESTYSYDRGGDLDELRIYDRALSDENVAALAKGETPQKYSACHTQPCERRHAEGVVVPLRLEPARRYSRSASRCQHHDSQGADQRRIRYWALVVARDRRHPRNHVAGRLQSLAPGWPLRLLPTAGLGLLRDLRQDRHLHHAGRAVEPPGIQRRRVRQHDVAYSGCIRGCGPPQRA